MKPIFVNSKPNKNLHFGVHIYFAYKCFWVFLGYKIQFKDWKPKKYLKFLGNMLHKIVQKYQPKNAKNFFEAQIGLF